MSSEEDFMAARKQMLNPNSFYLAFDECIRMTARRHQHVRQISEAEFTEKMVKNKFQDPGRLAKSKSLVGTEDCV